MFKVCSINCRGLNSANKRHLVFNDCSKYDVSFLQETYITDIKSDLWKSQWQGDFFFSKGTNHSNGLITLIKNGSRFQNPYAFYSSERTLVVAGTIDDDLYFFVNVYGPVIGSEKEKFINKLFYIFSLFNSDNIIVAGDFNLVINNSLDIISGVPHNRQHVQLFNNFINSSSLVDTWRLLHEDRKEFTWSRPRPFTARRLDFIFIHESLSSNVTLANINFNAFSDHKTITCSFKTDKFQRGKSYWKMNTSVLKDPSYVLYMNTEIEDFLKGDFDSPNEKLDLLKSMIKSKTILFCHNKNNNLKNERKILERDICSLNTALISDPYNPSL